MAFSLDIRGDKAHHLPLLVIIYIASHFPFVLSGFGEIDATKIAVSVIDIINHGPHAAFANYYFTDVVPLYIAYLKLCMKLVNYDYSYLPLVMNYTNAVAGTLTVIPAYLLIRRLWNNSIIAFCTVFVLIFSPSYYQAGLMGFPHLISLFFLLVSLNFYLAAIDHIHKRTAYLFMVFSAVFLTVAFLFKSDIVLVSGIYIGLLFVRIVKDKDKIAGGLLIIIISSLMFIVCRGMILGTTGGTTMSGEGLSKWYEYSISIPHTPRHFIRQAAPIVYGAGIVTSCLGSVLLVYFLLNKRLDILAFIVSWAAVPTLFWLVLIGNNARHNMFSVLPLIAIIIVFFHEKLPRYTIVLSLFLVLANYFITAPSYSILKPSGNLLQSNLLLEERMQMFRSRAREISSMPEKKIAVLGTFHNAHVVYDLMISSPSYEAVKIGREHYKMLIGDREYMFFYFVVIKPEDIEKGASELTKEYNLSDYVFVSASYDLQSLDALGLKTKKIDIIKRAEL
ncbi:MAG: hypothetical protein AB1499_11390 [Nitrospirota bacterium]